VLVGGMANPLYGIVVAYTNDYLEPDRMAAAAGGLIILNGIGAAGTPILVGYTMDVVGPIGFPAFVTALLGGIAVYALYRMTVRPSTPVDETMPVAPMGMIASPVAGTAAQEVVISQAEAEAEQAPSDWADAASQNPERVEEAEELERAGPGERTGGSGS
jgi:MFS family permease